MWHVREYVAAVYVSTVQRFEVLRMPAIDLYIGSRFSFNQRRTNL